MIIYPISWLVTGVAVCVAYRIIQKKLFIPEKAYNLLNGNN